MTEIDCIDSVIILGILLEENIAEFQDYVRTIGYKSRNKGLLTIPLVGEIFTNLFLKISKNVQEPVMRKILIEKAIEFFDKVIMDLLQQERLIISKIRDGDYQYIPRIKELDYAITDDDALHLSSAINNKCQRFITIDKTLLNERFRGDINREFRVIITNPTKVQISQ